jgi:predicted nucleotidyltransferase
LKKGILIIYKGKMMVDKNIILNILKTKKKIFNIRNFILFGSFAKETSHDNSDIDIAYIVEDDYKLDYATYIKLEEELNKSLENRVDLMNFHKINPLVKLDAVKDFIYV